MCYDTKQTNPPTHFCHVHLTALHQALVDYDGVDCYAHPYQKMDKGNQIEACVLVLMTNTATPKLLLTKRSRMLNAHAGEISFVGGRRDDTDTSTAHTALREAYEEVGLDMAQAYVIGYLPCQTAKSGILVRPVVAVIEQDVADGLFGSEAEIERIFWGELEHFLATPPCDITLHYDNRPPFVTPAWEIDGEVVWGLTGRIIANLLQIGFGVYHEWYYRRL